MPLVALVMLEDEMMEAMVMVAIHKIRVTTTLKEFSKPPIPT
jgi:hypothetical protein